MNQFELNKTFTNLEYFLAEKVGEVRPGVLSMEISNNVQRNSGASFYLPERRKTKQMYRGCFSSD